MALDLFAGIRVHDYHAAKSWYERLLGREPAFIPHATEAVWELAEHRYLFIDEDRDAPGGAIITIFVDDLDALAAEIASRGIEPAERVTYSNGVRKAIYRDADGKRDRLRRRPRRALRRRNRRPYRRRLLLALTYNRMVVDEFTDEAVDGLFHALSDATRRDILRRCAEGDPSVSRLAEVYPMSFAAVQKHVAVLERAGLVTKERRGREQLVHTDLAAVDGVRRVLDELEETWRGRAERMSDVLGRRPNARKAKEDTA